MVDDLGHTYKSSTKTEFRVYVLVLGECYQYVLAVRQSDTRTNCKVHYIVL